MGPVSPVDMLLPFALFVALILAAVLQGLAVSGHFPRAHAQPALASGFGRLILFGSMALVAVCLVAGIAAALRYLPWYAAIIGGGLSLLAAPLVLRAFPDRLVDGRGAPVAFAAAAAAAALLLLWLVVGSRCAAGEAQNWPPDSQTTVWLLHSECPQ
jgi:hypothetical protein